MFGDIKSQIDLYIVDHPKQLAAGGIGNTRVSKNSVKSISLSDGKVKTKYFYIELLKHFCLGQSVSLFATLGESWLVAHPLVCFFGQAFFFTFVMQHKSIFCSTEHMDHACVM